MKNVNLPHIDGTLSHDKHGHLLLDGRKILFKRVHKITRGRKEPIGIVVAIDKDHVGFSNCHSTLDDWNTEYGLRVAIGRAQKGKNYLEEKKKAIFEGELREINTIRSGRLRREYQQMQERAATYFQEI